MMHIRPATIADLSLLAALFDAYRRFYGQPSDLTAASAFLAERFERGESVLFLALDGDGDGDGDEDGTALGFTQLYPSFTSVGMRRVFILNDLYVVPEARKHGVGKALLSAAADHARRAGAARLRLSTAIDNHSAQALYEANGWVRDAAFYSYDLALG